MTRPLQALALILLVAVVVATVMQLATERRLIIADTERQMSRLDMVFAEQTGQAVETVDLMVRNSIDSMTTGLNAPDLQESFSETLRRRIAGVRQITALIMLNADGTIRYATGPTWQVLPEQAKLALAWHLANPAAGLRLSPPMRNTSGSWVSLLTRPIVEHGKVSGIGIALLNLGYFEEFYQSVELSENGSIILHLRDGTVLARFPHVDSAIGTSFGQLPPFTEVLAKGMAGTLLMESPLDGSIRVTAIRALKAFPLAVMVSVEQGQLLRDWRREAWLLGTAAGSVAVVMSGLTILLAQRSRQIDRLFGDIDAALVAAESANAHMRAEMAERERAEGALREAQRIEAVGRLTGGVAHDFNNLLTVVMGNVDLLLHTLPDDGQNATTTRLTAIREAAQKGATLTTHLLAFARRQPLMPQPTDLNDIVQGMRPLITSALGRRIRLELALAPDLWPALADPTQIELAILNLVMNARQAMPQGGVTYVRTVNRTRPDAPDGITSRSGDYVAVIVSDTGCGMAPDIAARAVEPFFTTKPPGAGSGLGLSHVLGTARQLGGDLTIDSKPGHGTSVSLLLPRAAAGQIDDGNHPNDSKLPETEGLPVLLVDDDEAARVVTGELLRSIGYRVAEAPTGEAALRLLECGLDARVLVTDLSMPGMDGSRLAAAARMLRPSIGVVIVSGHSDLALLAQGRSAHRVMRKPFQPDELHRQISLALAERQGVTTVTV